MSGLRARFDLVPEAAAARIGRRAVAAVLTGWGIPSYGVDDVLLIVSELITNAVVHAREATTLELVVAFDDSGLRVSLTDGSPVRPLPRAAARADEGGRGMAIISALADRWGVEDHREGKRIWFELDLNRIAPTRAEQVGDDAWDATDSPQRSDSGRQDA